MSYQASFSLRNFVLLTGSTYGGVAVKFSTIIQQRVKLMCLDLLWPRWAGFYLLTLMILWFGFVKYLSRMCSKQIRYIYQLQAISIGVYYWKVGFSNLDWCLLEFFLMILMFWFETGYWKADRQSRCLCGRSDFNHVFLENDACFDFGYWIYLHEETVLEVSKCLGLLVKACLMQNC